MAEVAFAVTWGIPAEPSGRVISGIGKALPEVQNVDFWLVLDILKVWPQHKCGDLAGFCLFEFPMPFFSPFFFFPIPD